MHCQGASGRVVSLTTGACAPNWRDENKRGPAIMTEAVEDLILEHLKHFQAGQDRIERDLKEIKTRLTTVEVAQGSLLQHIGHLASSIAQQQVSMDRTNDRIERIGKRLELSEA